MSSLDPVSQVFENQFIQAWELFEAQKFDEVSAQAVVVTTTAVYELTSLLGQQSEREAAARTTLASSP